MNARTSLLGALSVFVRGRVASATSQPRSPIARPMLILLALALIAGSNGLVSAAAASSSCPNEGFRTGPGANLPDCRAYEMVSPPEKNGGEVDEGPVLEGTPPNPEQAALNGEAVTYGSTTTFTEANPLSAPVTSQYISRRGPTGWYTQAITPVQNEPGGVFNREDGAIDFSLFHGFSEDLSHAFMLAYEPSPVAEAPAKYYNPYVRNNLDNTYRLLSKEKPPVQIPGISNSFQGFRIEYAGMSSDGSHVVFSANDKLTPGALPGKNNLYESNNGQLELVSVLPDGEATSGSAFGRYQPDQGGLNEGYNQVISRDGSRAFWTNYEYRSEVGLEEQIYMHELTPAGARTVHVSASQKNNGEGPGGTDPHSPLPAFYSTASANGNEVFFTSCEKLTNDSTAGPPSEGEYGRCHERGGESESFSDLYRYETSTGKLSDLSVDPVPGQTASLVSVLGASEDGSSVYFVAHGALVEGAPSGSSTYNIYLWHGGKVSLVSTLHLGDYTSDKFPDILFGDESILESNNVRVSPNGRYLAFESAESLTGYSTKPLQEGACFAVTSFWGEGSVNANHSGRCIEVYEYDANAGRLTCASCNPRGLPPAADSVVPMSVHAIVNRSGWQSETDQQRYLLDDGRLFFDSSDALLPQASNEKLNVYEYEPRGVGSCQREAGCISLISSGTSSNDSFFMDASASGNDVFFVTRQQLVAQDGDEAVDVYDARVGGGFLLAAPPPCGGEACRPPVIPAPAIYGAPPSATFVGAGNPAQPAVQSGTVKTKKKLKQKKSKQKHKATRKTGKKTARRSRAGRSSRGSHR